MTSAAELAKMAADTISSDYGLTPAMVAASIRAVAAIAKAQGIPLVDAVATLTGEQ